jgi:hypothetical protein
MRVLSSFVVRPLALAALLLVVAGCGSGPKLIPVEGQVTVGGQPLKTGTVTYHPDKEKGNTAKYSHYPLGTIDENGKYSLGTGSKLGAPAGHYKVTVHASVPSDPKDEYSEPRLLIDESNTTPETTEFTIEVKAGAPPGTYDLKLTK